MSHHLNQHRATRLPQQLGVAGWNAILPERDINPPLDNHIHADFVIIGAGFAGLTAARRIKQLEPSASITVLEAGRIAEGATGRNSGFMIDLPHALNSADYAGEGDEKALIKLNRQAINYARTIMEDYDINRNYFDQSGKINGAASDKSIAHNASYARHLDRLQEEYSMLDAQQMQEITGCHHYQAGLYTKGTVTLQPAGYIEGLMNGLKKQGVMIYENSPAIAIKKIGKAWQVETPKASVQAANVILTVNGHLESFGFHAGRLLHLFLYAVMTPELDDEALKRLGGQSRWGITPSNPMGTTVRRIDKGQGGNRLIIRTCATIRPDMQPSSTQLKRAALVMQGKFDQRFPQLAGMKMQYAWAGQLCLSLNSVSVMQKLDDGLFAGCVQNGLGTVRGMQTGMGAAELALGVTSDITRYFSNQDKPTRLLPPFLQEIGGNALLRYREWCAKSE